MVFWVPPALQDEPHRSRGVWGAVLAKIRRKFVDFRFKLRCKTRPAVPEGFLRRAGRKISRKQAVSLFSFLASESRLLADGSWRLPCPVSGCSVSRGSRAGTRWAGRHRATVCKSFRRESSAKPLRDSSRPPVSWHRFPGLNPNGGLRNAPPLLQGLLSLSAGQT